MADNQFKELIQYFKKSGLYDKSKIVLLSDHGSGWSEKEIRLTHGSNFYSPWANRIVLGFYPNLEGKFPRRINSLARSIDIYPTILELLDIKRPKNIDGVSLLPLMQGEKIEPQKLFAESGYSLRIQFGEEITIDPKGIRSELKRFEINPKNGFIYIRDQDYHDLLDRKWYMAIDKEQRLIYNPFLDITEAYRIDAESGEDISFISQEQNSQRYLEIDQQLLSELKKHFKIE